MDVVFPPVIKKKTTKLHQYGAIGELGGAIWQKCSEVTCLHFSICSSNTTNNRLFGAETGRFSPALESPTTLVDSASSFSTKSSSERLRAFSVDPV
jgi:hypothetical protein